MANGNFAGGTGTVDNPFLIEDAFDLNAVRNKLTANYKMIKNIDLNIAPFNTGSGWKPIGIFKGTFDGNGYTIKKLFINDTGSSSLGLFSILYSGIVKNLGVLHVNISGDKILGSICGAMQGSSQIVNCHSSGNINGSQIIGGITGTLDNASKIINCYSCCFIKEAPSTGGLIGVSYQGELQVVNSFWDIETTSQKTSSRGGQGLSTIEMKNIQNFKKVGWDNQTLSDGKYVWILTDGKYPTLQFEEMYSNKYLLKQNNQYYSIKSELYSDSKFQPITELQGKSSLSKDDYNNFGIDNLNILTNNMTVGTETFRPIDKFTGEIEIYKYTEK